MDSRTVKTFTDAVSYLLPALVQFASIANDQRTPEDEAMIRQLRVAAGALAHALMEVPRQQPPMPPQPAIQPPSPNVGSPS
jgi:hypothetical protein